MARIVGKRPKEKVALALKLTISVGFDLTFFAPCDQCRLQSRSDGRAYLKRIRGTAPRELCPAKSDSAASLLQGAAAGRGRPGRVVANHARLVAVETALTGSAAARRIRHHRIASGRCSGAGPERERISALGSGRENAINQVRAGRGCRSGWAEGHQGCGVAHVWIVRRVRHASGVDRT